MPDTDNFSDSFVIDLPVIIKAMPGDGKRMVMVEASNQNRDQEGDVVLQSALLNAATEFIRCGALDIDHLSEVGARYGISNPSDYIVGVPREVKDIGDGRTAVFRELHQSVPGVVTKADELWNGLTRNPPVNWRASIFGYPKGKDGFHDARVSKCPEAPEATRYVVKSMSWRSLAFTRNPINDSIEGSARIVTMKAHIDYLRSINAFPASNEDTSVKADPVLASIPVEPMYPMLEPRNRLELLAHYKLHMDNGKCSCAGSDTPLGRSVAGFRSHFMYCVGMTEGESDIFALALMQVLKHSGIR